MCFGTNMTAVIDFKLVLSVTYLVDLDLKNLKKVLHWLSNFRRINLMDNIFTESEMTKYQNDLQTIRDLIKKVEDKKS